MPGDAPYRGRDGHRVQKPGRQYRGAILLDFCACSIDPVRLWARAIVPAQLSVPEGVKAVLGMTCREPG